MFYHIKLYYRSNQAECRVNLSKEELIERYVTPYLNKEEISINGRVLTPGTIIRFKITKTEGDLSAITNRIAMQDKLDHSPWRGFNGSAEWRAIDEATDATEEFITRPPSAKVKAMPAEKENFTRPYVNHGRLDELRAIKNKDFDLKRLIKICEEMNDNWPKNPFSVIGMLRTVLNHIPPIFGQKNFESVANNYNGGSSFKRSMLHLLNSSKNIADIHLHSQIQKNEVLPNDTQVDYRNDFDLLLAEIVKLTS
jgi:hypothetical protein